MTARRSAPPRSLTDELRSRPDDDLAALLRDRPDLAVPLPPDLSALGVRAASRLSVQRALDALDAPALQVAEVLAALPEPVAPAQVSRVWGAGAGPSSIGCARSALVWGAPRARCGWSAPPGTSSARGPPVSALRSRTRSAAAPRSASPTCSRTSTCPPPGDPETALARLAEHLGRPHVVADLLAGAPEGVRGLLDRLTWGPPVGQVADADRPVRRGGAVGPVDWLLAHGLLGVADAGHVVLPREVALALRGGHVHRHALVRPPAVPAEPKPAAA